MIRESLYFMFDNRRSIDFNITNVSISNGLYDEPLMARKSIVEEKIRGNDKPYFVETEKEPLSFQLRFVFSDSYNDSLISEIVQWLDVDYYKPLSFSENMDRIYYAMPIDDITLIHNGLKQGYVTLNIRCDSPYSYSPEISTPYYDVSNGDKIIEINNLGNKHLKPEIFITKIGNGDLKITNLSRANSEFIFVNLVDSENIYIHCHNEIIESNFVNVYRYDSFNENYLSLPFGLNKLKIEGSCMIKFRYQYKFS